MGAAQDFRDEIRSDGNRAKFGEDGIFAHCVDCEGPLFSPRCPGCDPTEGELAAMEDPDV